MLDFYLCRLECGGELIERVAARNFPAHECGAMSVARRVFVDDDALAAIVHAKRQRFARAVDELQAEELFPEARPVVETARAHAEVAERVERHENSALS